MNITSEHNRKLAEALRPLALEPAASALPPRRVNRGGLIGIALLLAAGGSVWALAPFGAIPALNRHEVAAPTPLGAAQETAPTVAALVTPPVSVAQEISGSGYVVAPDTVTLFAKYEGRIANVMVRLGDTVSAGDPVVTIDDISAQWTVTESQTSETTARLLLEARQIDAALAQATYRRTQELTKKNAIARQELESAEQAWKIAENSVALAQQDLNAARLKSIQAQEHVDELIVRAPISGIVTTQQAVAGASVLSRADTGGDADALMVISNPETLVIDAEVAESNIAKLSVGLVGEAVLDGFPDTPFQISVDRIAPVVSAEKGTVVLRLALRNPPKGIRPNMAARIRLLLAEQVASATRNSQ